MGKNKLYKFKDMESFPNVFQYPFRVLKEKGFELRGKWNTNYFKNTNPVVLELGCGKGEYTVGLAQLFPDKNFIGIDIKGARIWSGAKDALNAKLDNVAFIRTHIELIDHFFDPAEVSEIWITFPDPQMRKVNKRMISTRFFKLYQQILKDNGIIHLKTDSHFLYTYATELIHLNELEVLATTNDLYRSDVANEILSIKTFYEKQWIERGLTIKYIKFICPLGQEFKEPDVDIPLDTYRSFNRGELNELFN